MISRLFGHCHKGFIAGCRRRNPVSPIIKYDFNDSYIQAPSSCISRGDNAQLLPQEEELAVFTVHGATTRGGQERHPPSREARRLLKQRSQESLRSRQEAGITWIDHSPTEEQQGQFNQPYKTTLSTF